jgi:P4 family phage/plasmid primase-like protien
VNLTLTELLTDVLGYTEKELVAVCTESPTKAWGAEVVKVSKVAALVDKYATGTNTYYSVNPVRSGLPKGAKGGIADVTRLGALWSDIDVKPGTGVASFEKGQEIIDTLSGWLGTTPTAVTRSGHGYHPLWSVERVSIADDEDRARVLALLARWKLAVRRAGASADSAPDSVYNLDRVLRAPGTQNVKDPNSPVDVVTEAGTGAPLTISEIEERLDEWGIPAASEPETVGGVVVSNPENWVYAEATCEYANRAIDGWAKDLAKAGRHPWLVAQSVRIGCMLRTGCLSQDGHERAVKALKKRFHELCTLGLGGDPREVQPGEVLAELRWGMTKASRKTDDQALKELGNHPHSLPVDDMLLELSGGSDSLELTALADGAGDEDGEEEVSTPVSVDEPGSGAMNATTMTDAGIADIVVRAFSPALRYCSDYKSWMRLEGTTWKVVAGDADIYQAVRQTISTIPNDDRMTRFKVKMLGASHVSGVVSLARRGRAFQVNAAELDSDPFQLNTPGGVIDIRTGEIVDSNVMHTRCAGTHLEYGPHPQFDGFMDVTFDGDFEQIAFVQRLLGAASIGKVTQILPTFWGAGRNGKGVLMSLTQMILGSYAQAAPENFLAAGRSEHPEELMRLHGARLCVVSEMDRGAKFADARLKMLTSPDGQISGRKMGGAWTDFTPSHTLILLTNELPEIAAAGPAVWDRIRVVGFEHYVPEDKRILDFDQIMFRDEGPQVLGWIMEGARQYLEIGLCPPPKVMAATKLYAQSQDPLGRFAEDCLVVDLPEDRTASSRDLYNMYRGWCRETGEKEITETKLITDLTKRYKLGSVRVSGVRLRTGLSINPESIKLYGYGMVRDDS